MGWSRVNSSRALAHLQEAVALLEALAGHDPANADLQAERTLEPALQPLPCATPVFADVPASSPFCRWIEELAARGVVSGCGGGNYCPQAPVTREQMAVFLTAGFGLDLYGP